MSPGIVGIIGIVVLLITLFSRMPIGFVMALVGFLGVTYLVSFGGGLFYLGRDFFTIFNSYTLSVIPLFLFMGEILFHSGVSSRFFYVAYRWLGHIPGGLAIATIGASAGFGAVCGSSVPATAAMGVVALPEMRRYHYSLALATGSIATGAVLSVMIPPSVTLIIYGILTQQSISELFIGSLSAGLILAILFMVTIYILCRRNPRLGPPGPAVSFKEKVRSLSRAWEMLALFALVMGGLFIGWFTPTEAGGIGAGGALLLVLLKRDITWQGFCASAMETVETTAMCFMILAGAVIFGHFLTVTRIPFELAGWVGALAVPRFVVLLIILLIYGISGFFIEGLAFFILTIPIFYPLAFSLGYDPIWFGVVITLVSIMGAVTPPVGINVYVLAGVAKDVPMETIFSGIWAFLPAFAVCTALLIAFPQIALFLPSLI